MTTPSNKTPSAAPGDDAPRRGRRRRLYASEPAEGATTVPAAADSAADSDACATDARATDACATDACATADSAPLAPSADDTAAERIQPLPSPEILDAERTAPSRPAAPRAGCIRSPVLRRQKARQTIHDHALLAGGAMAIPVPLLDIAAEAAIQVRMVHRLSEIYGLDFAEERAKALVAAAIGGFSTGLAANGVLRFASYLLNFWTSAAASAAITYGIGRLFMHHFERGGRLEDLHPDTAARSLRQHARNWRRSPPAQAQAQAQGANVSS